MPGAKRAHGSHVSGARRSHKRHRRVHAGVGAGGSVGGVAGRLGGDVGEKISRDAFLAGGNIAPDSSARSNGAGTAVERIPPHKHTSGGSSHGDGTGAGTGAGAGAGTGTGATTAAEPASTAPSSVAPLQPPSNSDRAACAALMKGPSGYHAGRKQLPIFEYASQIVKAVRHHRAVIITGETGSGKTTRACLPLLLV